MMQKRAFGRTGVELPVIGQGTWDIPESGAGVDAFKRALHRGLELGMTHIDTAEMYGGGGVERVLGDALRGVPRESYVLTSKVLPSNAAYADTLAACERSLKRLRVDYLDLYLLHWPSHVPLEETMRALAELVRQGKTRFVGISNFDVDGVRDAQAALGDIPLACDQVLYHLKERSIEHGLVSYAAREDVAIVAYTPFGRGQFPAKAAASDGVLGRIAAKYGATPRQVILAFLTRESNVFTIPKASNVAHVEENAGAGDLVLDDDDVRSIDEVFPRGAARPLATL